MRRYLIALSLLFAMHISAQTDSRAAAIQRACDAGVYTPEECRSQLAKLKQPAATTPAPTPQGGAGHWSEPHGRCTIAIAPGWTVDDSQGNLKVIKRGSWAIFETASRQGQAMDVAQANSKQMSGMVSGWQVVQQGPFETPRHHASAGVTAFANVPTRSGAESRVMTFAAQSAGSGNFVTL